MALEVNGYNAAFKAFADFAQQKVAAGQKTAVARPGIDEKVVITEAARDKAYAFTRSAGEKTANDAARALFKNAVAEMFGGESNIPEGVKEAMLLSDYGKGKPLTARRILAVKKAVDDYAAMKPARIDSAKARGMVALASKTLGEFGTIDKDAAGRCASLLKRYGDGLPEKTARVLANFIVNAAHHGGVDEEAVEDLANDIRKSREFTFGDKRAEPFSKRIGERLQTYVDETVEGKYGNPFMEDHPDVFKQLYDDADRGEWTIGGETFARDAGRDAILGKFLETVKNPNARKVISAIMHQGSLADLQGVTVKAEALVGDAQARKVQTEKLYDLPGGDMILCRDQVRDGCGILSDALPRYELAISEDGKTATVTVTIDKRINTIGSSDHAYDIGIASISQKATIDLTKDMPVITEVQVSHVFSPDTTAFPAAEKPVLVEP